MTTYDFYEDATRPRGGRYVQLRKLGESLKGTVVGLEKRDKTFEGKPVLSKSGNQRYEYVITLATDIRDADIEDDDGVRRYSMNEGDYSAFIDAWKEAGSPKPIDGWTVGIKCTAERKKATEWDTHVVKFIEAPKAAAAVISEEEF